MLISEEWREQNAKLHIERENFGRMGSWAAPKVMSLCAQYQTHDVLDYGCGKGTLNMSLPFGIHQYDPAIPKHSGTPAPADIVTCTDVMEHIEPECITDVLDDLVRVTKKVIFLHIACRPAKKTMPNGENAHCLVKPPDWWKGQIGSRFNIVDTQSSDDDIIIEAHAK